jgi:uncharacterized protein (DUF433 family)
MTAATEKTRSATVLDRYLYSFGEAARLLQIPTETLRRWLMGATRAGVAYPPVVRADPGGPDAVSWGEFVEAGLLREYRAKKISLQKMRPFIEKARDEFGVPYPLAHFGPKLDDKRLVYRVQQETGLDRDLYLVDAEDDQMRWAPPVERFLTTVEFDATGSVTRVLPLGPRTPVAIDPEVSFGVPQIRGVRTELVAESIAAGESEEEAARSWDLGPADVEAALAWEKSLAAAA